MACPNGAEPDPTFTLSTVALNVVVAGLAAVGGLPELVPWLFESPILGQQATGALCALNLDDPGNFQLSMLATPAGLDVLPSYDSPPGTLNRWIWDKTAYYFFHLACRCQVSGAKPPPPIVITMPPGVDTSPNQPGNSDQLTRIENNQGTSSDALLTLYNMNQVATTTLGDLRFRMLPNLILHDQWPSFNLSGEGDYLLNAQDFGYGASTQDVVGLWVELLTIPPTVARRGVTFQRLYGVGSLEWNVASSYTPGIQLIAQRDSLHYEHQFVLAPQMSQPYRVRWRLQPGVTARAWQVPRNTDNPFYTGPPPYNQAYQYYWNWNMPPGWTDKPFYPKEGAYRVLPGGASPP